MKTFALVIIQSNGACTGAKQSHFSGIKSTASQWFTLNLKFQPSAAQRQDCTLDTLLPPTLTNTTLHINFMCLCLNWGMEVHGENPHWTTHRKAQTGIKQCCSGLCYYLTARQVKSPEHISAHVSLFSLFVCVCVWGGFLRVLRLPQPLK